MPEPIQALPSDPGPSGPAQRTRLSPKWLGKTLLFLLILVAFGAWGLWDAAVVYPNSGQQFAENAKRQYLKACKDAGMLYSASIPDPAAAYARVSDPKTLSANRAAAADPANPMHARAAVDEKLYDWLDGLDTIWQLKPEQTKIEQPEKELERLEAVWQTKQQPKRLAKYDLVVQWLFVVVGLGGGLALGALIARVKARSYTWEPGAMRLGLPGGSSLVPDDIAEFDKRKWDKFLIFLKVKPGRGPHGGREVRLDLLRYVPLEEWVLAMERAAYPEHAPPPEEPPTGATEPAGGA